MEELNFKTKMTNDEIDKNFENVNVFTELMSGLEEALAYEKVEPKQDMLTRKRSLPEIDVAMERKSLHLTQKAFAAILGVSARTVEAWESGRSNPSPTARNLLYLLSQDHTLISVLQHRN